MTSLLFLSNNHSVWSISYLWEMCNTVMSTWLRGLSGEISRETIIDQLYNKMPHQRCPMRVYQSWVSEMWAYKTAFNITQLTWFLFKREKGEAKRMRGVGGRESSLSSGREAIITHPPFSSAKQRTCAVLISWAHLDQGKVPCLTFYDIPPSGNFYVEAY